MAHASSVAETAWVEAKQRSDFAMLLPHLEKNVELTKRWAAVLRGLPRLHAIPTTRCSTSTSRR